MVWNEVSFKLILCGAIMLLVCVTSEYLYQRENIKSIHFEMEKKSNEE